MSLKMIFLFFFYCCVSEEKKLWSAHHLNEVKSEVL